MRKLQRMVVVVVENFHRHRLSWKKISNCPRPQGRASA